MPAAAKPVAPATQQEVGHRPGGKKQRREPWPAEELKAAAFSIDRVTNAVLDKTIGPEAERIAVSGTAMEKWGLVWGLLTSTPEMAKDSVNYAEFKDLMRRSLSTAKSSSTPGPICANPACGKIGHTIAVCPVPTCLKRADMSGCFFCNTITHEADDCSMMKWVTPSVLVTHLITNRAGMPPWCTRLDWVALAIDKWELVDFNRLPLTRDTVRRTYIPNKSWERIDNGPSPITDPLFKNADVNLLEALASTPKPDDPVNPHRIPLMESSEDLCYCRKKCSRDDGEHTVFENEAIQQYITDIFSGEAWATLMAQRERQLAANALQPAKQMPKKVVKERKGRRAMKKEALAAAAAAAAGKEEEEKQQVETDPVPAQAKKMPSVATAQEEEVKRTGTTSGVTPSSKEGRGATKEGSVAEDEQEVPVSKRLLDLTDELSAALSQLQSVVKL